MARCLQCSKIITNKPNKPYRHEYGYLCSQKCVNNYCGVARSIEGFMWLTLVWVVTFVSIPFPPFYRHLQRTLVKELRKHLKEKEKGGV